MPSANIRDTLMRHWRLMELLPRQPRTITITDIHVRLQDVGFQVTRRTVERDLLGLTESGFPIVADKTQEPYLWAWDAAAPSLTLPVPCVSDALLLAMVRDHIGPMLPPHMLDALRPYLDRAVQVLDAAKAHNTLANWRDKVHAVLPTQALIPPPVDESVHRAVSDALMQETQLEVVYDSMTGKKGQTMTVHPHALFHRGQMTYLVCTCWDYTSMRNLALHRIRKAVNTFAPMVKQVDFKLASYLGIGRGDFGSGELRNLDLTIAPGLAEYLAECKLATDQVLTHLDEPAGWYRLQVKLPDTPELERWLLGQGGEVRGLALGAAQA
jgi:predicted DNA-binding transcriptional regulator YafY